MQLSTIIKKVRLYIVLLLAAIIVLTGMCCSQTAQTSTANNTKVETTSVIDPIEALAAELGDKATNSNPKVALEMLAELASSNPLAKSECHYLVHAIGHAAYDIYGLDGSLQYESDYCGSGYVHGIIERAIADAPDPLAILPTICQPSDGRCFHGIGHGVMYFENNDITKAISLCDALSNRADRVNCGEGIFMENFSIDLEHHQAPNFNPDDPLASCTGWEDFYQSSCYFYAARYYYHEQMTAPVADLFAWCQAVPQAYRADCIRGLGSGFIKYTMSNPPLVRTMCQQALTVTEKELCINGMVSYYIVYFASTRRGEWLCENELQDFSEVCSIVLAEKRKFFQDYRIIFRTSI